MTKPGRARYIAGFVGEIISWAIAGAVAAIVLIAAEIFVFKFWQWVLGW